MIKFITTISLALVLSVTSAMADVSVTKKGNEWQVNANDEPITSVLKTLGKQAGIKISGTNKLIADPQITGNWNGPLEEVLARILRGTDYATETATAKDGSQYIVRLIVLSGEIGQSPTPRTIQAARRMPAPPAAEQTEQLKKDGARVTGLLETKARVVAGLPHSSNNPVAEARTTRAGGGNGITRNEDGSFDIDPETQARLAEATRRAQADLQALVNALQQNEQGN
ncbi:MAG: hypothetical protein L3J04_06510 [Robiginitomaculum sp.]|nr:hypothetical protein [Robiginitomaculum sp.]